MAAYGIMRCMMPGVILIEYLPFHAVVNVSTSSNTFAYLVVMLHALALSILCVVQCEWENTTLTLELFSIIA